MSLYDYIKINEELKFYFIWDKDKKLIKTSFNSTIIKDIKKGEQKQIKNIIADYFFHNKTLININYELSPKLTDFEIKVLKETKKIPYGKTLTYTDIAIRIGNRKAYRAVGNALGKNPLPVIIPCHRVISKNGLGGFTGGLEIKKYLLILEGVL